jgi:nucleoid DNA-binding protein
MANRSYLYSIDDLPSADRTSRNVIGLSEWASTIPLVNKLMVSGNPQLCRSMIWKNDQPIAIVGNYDLGLQLVSKFLADPHGKWSKSEAQVAIDFLSDAKNRQQFALLECGEIFGLRGSDLASKAEALLKEIKDIDNTIAKFWADNTRNLDKQISPDAQQRSFADLVGLGNWSNILYFDLSRKTKDSSSDSRLAADESNVTASTELRMQPSAMKISEVIHHLAGKTGLSIEQVGAVLREQAKLAYKSAEQGYPIPGIGILKTISRPARSTATQFGSSKGKVFKIPESKKVTFRVAQVAFDAVLSGSDPSSDILNIELSDEGEE